MKLDARLLARDGAVPALISLAKKRKGGRPMTTGEVAMVDLVFGKGVVNPTTVKIHKGHLVVELDPTISPLLKIPTTLKKQISPDVLVYGQYGALQWQAPWMLPSKVFTDLKNFAKEYINEKMIGPYAAEAVAMNAIIAEQNETSITPFGEPFFPTGLYHDDFSVLTPGDKNARIFIHEMAHVWQFQRGIDVAYRGALGRICDFMPACDGCSTSKISDISYNFTYSEVASAKSLTSDFGIEQQASIFENYYYKLTAGPDKYIKEDLSKGEISLAMLQKLLKSAAPTGSKGGGGGEPNPVPLPNE